MLKTRLIPCLLISNGVCVKTLRFKNPCYLGDPINIVKIFNEKSVDEIMILDVSSDRHIRLPDYDLIERIVSQAFMPVSFGGGIKTSAEARRILSLGVEKVVVGNSLLESPEMVKELSSAVGAQSIVASVEVKQNFFSGYSVFTGSAKKASRMSLSEVLTLINDLGVGEIFLQSIDHDGVMNGFDIDLISYVQKNSTLPVIACSGAGHMGHIEELLKKVPVSAVAAGSMFVYFGKHKAVLISYPSKQELVRYLNRG